MIKLIDSLLYWNSKFWECCKSVENVVKEQTFKYLNKHELVEENIFSIYNWFHQVFVITLNFNLYTLGAATYRIPCDKQF